MIGEKARMFERPFRCQLLEMNLHDHRVFEIGEFLADAGECRVYTAVTAVRDWPFRHALMLARRNLRPTCFHRH